MKEYKDIYTVDPRTIQIGDEYNFEVFGVKRTGQITEKKINELDNTIIFHIQDSSGSIYRTTFMPDKKYGLESQNTNNLESLTTLKGRLFDEN